MAVPTDDELLDRLRRGDAQALADAYAAHGEMVWRACRRQVGAADAEDAAQAVFILLWRKAQRIPAGTALAGWCHRAAVLAARAQARAERRRRRRERAAVVNRDGTDERDAQPPELGEALDATISRLPRAQRDAIVLVYLEERDRAQAARALGISDEALRRRLSDALARLRRALGAAAVGALGAAAGGEAPASLPAAIAGLGDALARDKAPTAVGADRLARAVSAAERARAAIGTAIATAVIVAVLVVVVARSTASSSRQPLAADPPARAAPDDDLPAGPPTMLGEAQRAQPGGGRVVLWSRNRWGNYPLSTYDFARGLRGDHPDVANDVQLVFGNRANPGGFRGRRVDSFPSPHAQSGSCGMDGGGRLSQPVEFRVGLVGGMRATIADLGDVDLAGVAAPAAQRVAEDYAQVVVGHTYLVTLKSDRQPPRWVALRVAALRDDDAVLFDWRPLPPPPLPPTASD